MKRLICAAAIAGSLATSTPADAACNTRACEIRVARKACDKGSVKACILRAALHRRQSYPVMLRVAWCESRLNPRAVSSGGHRGLFQFAYPSTWNTTPYRTHSPFSAKWASLAAAWAFSVGRKNEWSCQ